MNPDSVFSQNHPSSPVSGATDKHWNDFTVNISLSPGQLCLSFSIAELGSSSWAADEASTSNIEENSEQMRVVLPITCWSLEEPGGIFSLGSRWHCMPAARFRMLQRWQLLDKG